MCNHNPGEICNYSFNRSALIIMPHTSNFHYSSLSVPLPVLIIAVAASAVVVAVVHGGGSASSTNTSNGISRE